MFYGFSYILYNVAPLAWVRRRADSLECNFYSLTTTTVNMCSCSPFFKMSWGLLQSSFRAASEQRPSRGIQVRGWFVEQLACDDPEVLCSSSRSSFFQSSNKRHVSFARYSIVGRSAGSPRQHAVMRGPMAARLGSSSRRGRSPSITREVT